MIQLTKQPTQDSGRTGHGKCDKSSNRMVLRGFGIRWAGFVIHGLSLAAFATGYETEFPSKLVRSWKWEWQFAYWCLFFRYISL